MTSWKVPVAIAGGVLLAGLLGVGVGVLIDDDSPGTSVAGAEDEPTSTAIRRVTVDGTGTVTGTPDTVTIRLGVQTRASSANAALDEANTKAAALIDTLVRAGVAEVDIATVDVSVWPVYDDKAQTVTGYTAGNAVVAKLRDLDKAGQVIDAAAGAVGDAITLGGIAFTIEDTTALYEAAREQAVERARTQAEQLATAAGAEIGDVLSIDETLQEVPVVSVRDLAGAAADEAASVPIEPGSQELRLTVRVTYELRS